MPGSPAGTVFNHAYRLCACDQRHCRRMHPCGSIPLVQSGTDSVQTSISDGLAALSRSSLWFDSAEKRVFGEVQRSRHAPPIGGRTVGIPLADRGRSLRGVGERLVVLRHAAAQPSASITRLKAACCRFLTLTQRSERPPR